MSDSLFKRLIYVYIATSDFEADYAFYKDTLGARRIWEYEKFGAKVAAFDLCGEPYLLIADHVKPPSKRLIYEVENLEKSAGILKERGWKPDGEPFEVPDGMCYNFTDRSGNEYAILEMSRPFLLEREFRKENKKRV